MQSINQPSSVYTNFGFAPFPKLGERHIGEENSTSSKSATLSMYSLRTPHLNVSRATHSDISVFANCHT